MRSIDTNVVARFLLDDDPIQSPIAHRLFQDGVFIAVTVLLEVAWLLSSRYGFDRRATVTILDHLLDLPTVVVADCHRVRWALSRVEDGGDFADLLHVALSGGTEAFATFDRGVARAAGTAPPVRVETLA